MTTNNSSEFHLFTQLPPELRNQIWSDALPDIGPALFKYEEGYWRQRYLPHTSEEVNDDETKSSINSFVEFNHELIEGTQFELPLLFTCRESRGICLSWIDKHSNVKRCAQQSTTATGSYPLYVQRFDHKNDALYIGWDQWDSFVTEPFDLADEIVRDESDFACYINPSHHFRFVISATLAVYHLTRLRLMTRNFSVEDLFIIVKPDNLVNTSPQPLEFSNSKGEFLFEDKDEIYDPEENVDLDAEYLNTVLKGITEEFDTSACRKSSNFNVCPIFGIQN